MKISGAERYLHYLPRRIYIRFGNVEWQIHPRLGKGVIALHPVTRSWELNKATCATIKRRGFTPLPDYASTAFMIQGATLTAGLADCGDILDMTGYTEMMRSYAILSRLTDPSGLLLLRAFSPHLFRTGTLPGPHCLLKLLRHRFQHEQGSDDRLQRSSYNARISKTNAQAERPFLDVLRM